ncbi:hypothetical protein [Oceanobacillus sp. FSL K6-3682]|uniref:hypothetical protein n=1 Tax=Oceanobacillus sp. FSL K6-3682 TaxID=2921503 RepID=UPI0030DBDFDD
MSKGLKIILLWSLAFPAIITIGRMIIDSILSREMEFISYTAVFFRQGCSRIDFWRAASVPCIKIQRGEILILKSI